MPQFSHQAVDESNFPLNMGNAQAGQPGYAQPGQPGRPGHGQNGQNGQPGRPGHAQNGASSQNGASASSGQAVPWNVLPEGSYSHPYQSGRGAQTFRYAADAAVELPLASDTLFLAAQGSGFSGLVNVEDDGRRGADSARVDIRMYYTAQRLAEDSKAWKEQPVQGQNGVRIMVRLTSRVRSLGCLLIR